MRQVREAMLTAAVGLLLAAPVSAQVSRGYIDPSYPVVQSGTVTWIGTPQGLFQYNPSSDTFIKFPLPGKNKDARVTLLYLYREWLWCVLDSGLAALQVPLNDWLYFDTTKHLPSNHVLRLDFQEDYVWAATDRGLARFDMMIEQWEVIDSSRGLRHPDVADVKGTSAGAWVLNGTDLSEYDPRFEQWRHFPIGNDSTGALKSLFLLSGDLWIVAERGLLKFDPRLQSAQPFLLPYLAAGALIEIYIENTRLWAVTRSGLYTYEVESGVWREFEGNSGLQPFTLTFGLVNGQQIWALANQTTLLWDRTLKTWTILDYSRGLSWTSYASVMSDGEMTMLFSGTNVEYQSAAREPWRKRELAPTGHGDVHPLAQMFDSPEGGSLNVGGYDWGWQGSRVTWLHDRTLISTGKPGGVPSSDWRFDVKSQLSLGGGRRVNGFYNNVDYEETKYGARFRGHDSDIVREVAWGDFRRETGTGLFSQSSEMFGGALWLEQGAKTERYHRSLVSARAAVGEVRSRSAYEHFHGISSTFRRTIRDVDYARFQFFNLPGIDSTDEANDLEIFVDDLTPMTNGPRTLRGAAIGGMRGDFDPWVPVEEFMFIRTRKCLRMTRPVLPGWSVVARYSVRGVFHEEILQMGGQSNARCNVYALGEAQIVPRSFRLSISDTLGRDVPPFSVGLDADRDGIVDESCVDFEGGLLWFRTDRPFPAEVYDAVAPHSLMRLVVEGETALAALQLQHQNLVRGSEIVTLDAIPAVAGNDYVLDYTNGTLIFVREEAVSADTRIEVEYQYYDPLKGQLTTAGVTFSPSDNFSLQGEWQSLPQDSAHLLSLQSEIRQQIGGFDLRVIPGAVYQPAQRQLTAGSAEALLSSPWLRLRSRYDTYTRDYKNLYVPQSVVGTVSERLSIYGALDVREDLRLTGDMKRTRGIDSAGSSPHDQTVAATALYHPPDLPSVEITYQSSETASGSTLVGKNLVLGQLEYQVPQSVVTSIGMKTMRVELLHRKGRESRRDTLGFRKDGFSQTTFRINALVREQISAGFSYRSNSVDEVTTGNRPVSSFQRLLADAYLGEWRVMQVSLRLENTLQQEFHRFSPAVEASVRQFSQVNARISPGQVWGPLSSLFFEVNYNQVASQSALWEHRSGEPLWRISPPTANDAASEVIGRSGYVKNEFRPDAFWLFTTLAEWGSQEVAASKTRLIRTNWQITEKADVRLALATRITGQYRQSCADAGAGRTTGVIEPSVWLEQRWSEDLLSTMQILYRRTTAHTTLADGLAEDWGGAVDITFRKDRWALMRHVELRQSISANLRISPGIPRQRNVLLTGTTSMDLYPVHALIIRLRCDWNRYRDELISAGGYDTVTGSLKVALQL